MLKKSIQIVAFDNPYPANFGGVIDVFFKIEALAEQGIEIYLHFFYSDRIELGSLPLICEKVYTYKRDISIFNHFYKTPFRVKSRTHNAILKNLNDIDAPIIFEGLHSTSVIKNAELKPDFYIRAHNIEHQYTNGIAKSETHLIKKIAHYLESYKLKIYQKKLKRSIAIFALSKYDYNYFKSLKDFNAFYVPVFHGNKSITVHKINENEEKFALYHGDLSSASNQQSVFFLIEIFKNLKFKFVIAGSETSKSLLNKITETNNCHFKYVRGNDELTDLIANAHVNVLYSNQKSGTKLKVFNALYKGRFVIVNNNIVDDQDILNCCILANTKKEYIIALKAVFNQTYKADQVRIETLDLFSDKKTAIKLINLLN